MTITISTRVLGNTKPLLADFSVPPPRDIGDGEELLLRDLIEHVVRQQVAAFRKRQKDLRFDRVLTAEQIEAGAKAGKVDPAAKSFEQDVDGEQAVGNALQSFEDGLYLVIVDEVERRTLDEPVRLRSDSCVTFIRLTFIAGGW